MSRKVKKSFLVRSLLARRMTLSRFQRYYGMDGKPTFHRRANLSWFSKICNQFREIAAWSQKSLMMITVFWKKDPLRANFQKIILKGFTTSQNHVLCANFVKFGWPEIGKVVRCLPDKKKQNFRKVSRSCFCAYRAQNLLGPAPNNILGVTQISSKSVHFWRSYSRTCEHRWNTPQSISNTRQSFFAE